MASLASLLQFVYSYQSQLIENVAMRRTSRCTLIALFLLPPSAVTLNGEPAATLRFENQLTTFDRIPSPSFGRVSCIIRDKRGFLWFGTTRGLCRYDGYEAKVYSNGPSLNMKQQAITSIVELDDKTFLLGTVEGLWTFDLEKEEFAPFSPDPVLLHADISDLARSSGNNVFIGTNSSGLINYNLSTGSLQTLTTDNGLIDKSVSCLLLDQTGTLWVGTYSGLQALDTSHLRLKASYTMGSDNSTLSSNHITALYRNDKGELWIGTTIGVHILELQSGKMRPLEIQSFRNHTIWSITEDPAGRIWVAVSEVGLFAYANGQLTQLTTLLDNDRSLVTVRTLYPDPVASSGSELLLWIGTRTGVNKMVISQNPFTSHIRGRHSLHLNRGAVLSLFEDRDGILWVGLWGGGLNGLRRVNGTFQQTFKFEKNGAKITSLPNNDVGSVIEDRNGRLWVGTRRGVAVFNSQRQLVAVFKHTDDDSTSILDNDISSILEDRSGTIWISTHGGLSAMPPNEFGHFKNYLYGSRDAHQTRMNIASDLMEDRQSNLWIGTHGRGLIKREPDGTFKTYLSPGDPGGTHENLVYNMVAGREGNIWLSTGSGLVSFDPQAGRFEPYPLEHLNDAIIFGVFENSHGDLWLSTSIGLAKFNPKTRAFVHFDDTQGIPFKELRCGFHLNSRGKLLVGGLDGFVEFDPDSASPQSVPPAIVVTSFSIFDNELPSSTLASKRIRLSHDQNFISFTFAALDYVNTQQNRFAYMMEGVDKDWIQAGTRNYASYTHLDPGKYLFRIKGSNGRNVWNEAGTSLSIIITPPYWQTWWFRIVAVLVILSGAYAAYRYRLRKALEVERMRLRIADDLHDDVGSNLGTIAMVTRTLQRSSDLSPESAARLAEIYDMAVNTSDGMRDIVWFIKPKNDMLDDMFLRMKDTASTLLANIQHEFHVSGDVRNTRITIDFKRNFFLAFKEILTNIVKHASATKVQILIHQRDDMLELVVRDDGLGFDPIHAGATHRGNGLTSLTNRAGTIAGVCQVVSEPGQGTTVRFSGKI